MSAVEETAKQTVDAAEEAKDSVENAVEEKAEEAAAAEEEIKQNVEKKAGSG